MKNFDMKKINQAGSLMIEAIAMLGLISLVTPVVYKKSAERMTELQDINAASHMRMLSSALDAYISDNYDNLKDGKIKLEDIKFSDLENYLPKGALVGGTISGPLGDKYKLSVQKSTPEGSDKPIFTGYVAADITDDKITPQRTSRIATMIGGNGAVVDEEKVYGVQGTWETTPSAIGLDGISDNSVVVASQNAVGATAQIDTSKFLYRVEDDVENNTMQTNLYMWGNDGAKSIEGVRQLLIGHQEGRDGNKKNNQDDDITADAKGYALYVSSKGAVKNTWLGGSLEAARKKLRVTETEFKYNPYETVETGGSAINDNSGLTVNSSGMTFSRTGTKDDKFMVDVDTLSYGDGLISADIGKEESGKTRSVSFFKSSTTTSTTTSSGTTTKTIDTSAATFTEGEARFFGETDGPKVSIKKDGTTIRNQLVAMNPKNIAVAGKETTYTTNAGFGDYYTRIGESAPAKPNYKVSYSDAKNANILSGRTIATQLETGYLKSDNFDTKSLRAGRSNLNDSEDSKDNKETWNLDVDEKGVKIGYRRDENGNISTSDDPNYAYINIAGKQTMSDGMQTALDGNSTKDLNAGSIHMRARFQVQEPKKDGVAQFDIGRVAGGVAVTVDKGNVNTTVTNGNINMVSNGGAVSISNKKGTLDTSTNETTYDEENAHLNLRNDGNADLQGNEYVFIQTNNTGQQGNVVLQNGVLAVSDTRDTSHHIDDKVASSDNATAATAGVYIRRGSIDVNTFSYDKNKDGEDRAADAGTGYVKADRFVVENVPDVKNEVSYVRNPNEVYKDKTIGQGERYDHYMVDPAYTSVMHDIKLTSRGGARLSDILPDFINKGIYVTDNSYGEGTKPRDENVTTFNPSDSEYGTKGAVKEENAVFASAFLGVVPAPQCPPGYAKVITLTPAGWRMAQIGTLVEDSTSGNRLYLNETTPEYKDNKIIKETEYAVTNSGSNSVVRIPKIFQQNTWLKSAIKLNTSGVSEDKKTGSQYWKAGNFVGWNTYMGFIYPAVLWKHLFKNDDGSKPVEGVDGTDAPQLGQGDNTIYWNLFPVDKWSIEGYATVYCYFDRNGLTNNSNSYFNENMVDTEYNQYSSLRTVEQGVERSNTKYIKRLNNPKLKYTQEW